MGLEGRWEKAGNLDGLHFDALKRFLAVSPIREAAFRLSWASGFWASEVCLCLLRVGEP